MGRFGAINGFDPFVGRVLRAKRWWMIEFCETARDVPGHGDVHVAGVVVPVKGEAAVEGSGPVDGEFVVSLDGANEMESIELGVIFDAEIVDAEDKRGLFSAMAPETGSERHGFVAIRS